MNADRTAFGAVESACHFACWVNLQVQRQVQGPKGSNVVSGDSRLLLR
ncbi:MAG: hypothetical protein ABR898_04635 [Terracidiphilus sp.]